MLSPADAELVARDPSLPGLGTLLDMDVFREMVQSVWPKLESAAARICYVRYKPHTSCLVGYQLHVQGEWVDVAGTANGRDAADKLAKARNRSEPASIDELSIVLSRFPHDDGLPALRRLMDPVEQGQFLERVISHRPELWSSRIEPMRYKPERRFVARLMVDDEPRAILKVYSSSGFAAACANLKSFRSQAGVACPERLGRSHRHRVVVSRWLPGRVLFHAMTEPGFDVNTVEEVGEALATLHGQEIIDLAVRSRRDETASLTAVADWVAHICPNLRERVQHLSRRLSAEIVALPPADRPVHGDFYSKQVLLGEGPVGIIDFDEAFRGDPAQDLGSFLAHLERDALRGMVPEHRIGAIRSALITGYGHSSPDRVDLYAAVNLLRLAPHPFRNREENWPEATAALLDRAAELMQAATQDQQRKAVAV